MGKPQNCGPQSLLQSVDGVFAFTWGRCPQTPGITALGQQWLAYMSGGLSIIVLPLVGPEACEEGRAMPAPPLPGLSRRSGRIPAEPVLRSATTAPLV